MGTNGIETSLLMASPHAFATNFSNFHRIRHERLFNLHIIPPHSTHITKKILILHSNLKYKAIAIHSKQYVYHLILFFYSFQRSLFSTIRISDFA